MAKAILDAIEDAAQDLLYMSESDEPFEIIHWQDARGEPSGEAVRRLGGHDLKETVTEMPLDEFFKPLTEEKKWHDEDEKAEVQRYQKLQDILKKNLCSVKVFRVGEIELDI